MVTVQIDRKSQMALRKAIKGTNRKLKKELATAVNATTKKTKGTINKQIRSELAVKKKAIDTTISVVRKADAKAKVPTGAVKLKKTGRMSLKEFGARQTKKGTSYKVSKTQGRRTVPGAFMGPRPGAVSTRLKGHAFKREGQSRLPIQKLHGPSPWGVFVKRRFETPTKRESERELKKQIERRVKFITLKKSGEI